MKKLTNIGRTRLVKAKGNTEGRVKPPLETER